jgi:4-hydroxythreonine-4-phosphate dehydrogenase
MATLLRIGITTGDADGVGTEVASKALRRMGPQRGVRFYLWRSPTCPPQHLKRIDSKFKRITFMSWAEAQQHPDTAGSSILFDICSHQAPPHWVEQAADACMFRKLDGLVTGPLSKTLIASSGLKDIGHTSILKRIGNVDDVFMGFFGKYFNVALVTDHLPLAQVPRALSAKKLESAMTVVSEFCARIEGKPRRPIAVLGLNPHSGEDRLLGDEEADIISPLIKKLNEKGGLFVGPLVPDAAFLKQNWEKYSLFLALYHDQGLIPFKAFHGQKSGVHISLGLPFVRTSVDHGTAKDIFGKERAEDRSMTEALQWAIRLARKQGDKKLK